LSEKHKVTKRKFNGLYAKAHINALTKPNILVAFSKTGIVPFNPDVITEVMMAPSVDSSITINNSLPLLLDKATQAVVDFIAAEVKKAKHMHTITVKHNNQELEANKNMVIENTNMRSRSNSSASVSSQDSTATQQAHQIVGKIANLSSAHLLHSSPLCSNQPAPIFMPHPFSPTKNRYDTLLMEPATTKREEALANALWEAAGRVEAQKSFLMGMQATKIMQGMYVKLLLMCVEACSLHHQAQKNSY
jgi:hypothetical protein